MSDLPISSKYRSTPDKPVDEQERNDLSERLGDAFTRGLIDADAYRERLDLLYAARTLGELVPVVDGLPPRQTYNAPAIVEQGGGEPGELVESRSALRPAVLLTGGVVAAILVLGLLIAILLL